MRAAMNICNRNTAIKRAAKGCLVAVAVMGVAQFGLSPLLDERGQLLVSALDATLALQGIGMMLIVSFGRLRVVALRLRLRELALRRVVRNPWYRPGVAIEVPVRA
jgi:hypothetical protein